LQDRIQYQEQSRDSYFGGSIVEWGVMEMNCHFCQVAIVTDGTKLRVAPF
jgi:hypothetical protein